MILDRLHLRTRPQGKSAYTGRRHLLPASLLAFALALQAPLGQAALAPAKAGFAPSNVSADPPVVARLETSAPHAVVFVLRGTIPVPEGTYVPETFSAGDLAAAYPLVVRDSDGTFVLPQLEVVSRYPNNANGAAVLEVLATVRRPANVPPGGSVSYDVVLSEGLDLASIAPFEAFSDPLESLSVSDSVLQFLTHPIGPYVRARDVHGNWYSASLLNGGSLQLGVPGATDWTRRGHEAASLRNYATMAPTLTAPASGQPLDHLFGVHSYLGAFNRAGYLSLDLRLVNGFSNANGSTTADDPIGTVYFRDLEVVLPSGYGLVPTVQDQALGNPYDAGLGLTAWPLAENPADGKCHAIGQGFQLHRRFAITGASALSSAIDFTKRFGQGFCQPGFSTGGASLWSWWNPATSNYFPQRHRLPTFDHLGKQTVLAEIESEFQYLTSKLALGEAGAPPLTSSALGWAHPYGQAYGGVTGGIGIYLYEGVPTAWAAARNGYRHLETLHRMQMDRTRNLVVDADGTFAMLDEWLLDGQAGPFFPGNFYMVALPGHDPFGWQTAPTHQETFAQDNGLVPDYASQLLIYDSYDMQHLIRATRAAKALAWLGNDALAKDDLLGQAALVEISYNMAYNNSYGQTVPTGMRADREFADQHPGIGMEFSRAEGWGIDLMSAVFALGDPAYRADHRAWFDDLVDLVQLGQAQCSGFLTAEQSSKILGGKYRARQAYSHAIVENGLYGALKSAYEGTGSTRESILEDVLRRAFYGFVDAKYWDPVRQAPYQQAAVAPLDLSAPLFCSSIPIDGVTSDDWDSYQCWSSFAYGFEMTFDPVFLIYASWLIGDIDLGAALQAGGTNNVQNRAALLALSQTLGL